MKKKIISKSLKETEQFAHSVLSKLKSVWAGRAIILLLKGDLGSGKTTFVQFLAKHLGVKNHIASPTFVLMKRYKISTIATERLRLSVKNLVHIDAYRLNSGQDLLNLGWAELVANPDNLIILEWPERVADLWDGSEYQINFKFIDEKTREMSYFPYGSRETFCRVDI